MCVQRNDGKKNNKVDVRCVDVLTELHVDCDLLLQF